MSPFFIIITVILLLILGAILFIRNQLRLSQALQAGEEIALATEISWEKSLRHSIAMYLAAILVLVLPFIAGKKPGITDVFQAATIFLVIYYLKNLYERKN